MDANPTLDQLQVFIAVAESGSFSAASRLLNRAQSVVSYTIANLETQLEIQLFDRAGARQPKLTEAGRAMLMDARRIVADLQIMRSRAKSITQGLEAEITLAVSVMVPADAVVSQLREFREKFPSVALNLSVGELGMVMGQVISGRAGIGIGGALLKQDDSLIAERIGHSYLLPVAAPDHPLVKLNRTLTLADVRDETQLVVTDASGLTAGRNFNVLSYKIWRISDIATKYQLIKGGLGWGGLPASLVLDDIRNGDLVALDIDAYEQGQYPIYALRKASNPPGPAGQWLIESFAAKLSSCPNHDDLPELLKQEPERTYWQAAE
ncbi:LysR family transcriptional regulator [Rhizobium sp. Leaf306]|jgi:DNA-binding transcriptional LysR family regulator|uniref:LysR family transcriptional regulator n=1 Tax=Rhizobium/Agrobacterium group TaxID=227290 RepID=UPI00071423FE|nr:MULTISPECIES: LysR family transcriptional regulator [unclassified Rhizobium]KQQ37284.1 LysR family transcriptional regulator [Rhizobium sp. Leaf306]MBD8663399.1 LysR family transcriptional regulator [Rhizobium sp. CFBP 8752]RYE70069.1 MAG: LysR family transcriptional regulator [Rhizobiaceae bacterium]